MPAKVAATRTLSGWPAACLLVEEEHHVAAIEQRNRQEVDHGEIHAQHRQEQDELREALAGHVVQARGDGDRPACDFGNEMRPTMIDLRLR